MATRSKGDGSIYQRTRDGKWVGTIDVGWRDGKRKRRQVTGDTRAKVVQRMRGLRAEVDAGVLAENITVEKWLVYWLDEVCAERLKASTLYNYRNYCNTWAIPTLGKLELRKLKPEHVRRLHRKRVPATTTGKGSTHWHTGVSHPSVSVPCHLSADLPRPTRHGHTNG